MGVAKERHMRKKSRARTAAKAAEHDFSYQPSLTAALLALALAICLMWHGMARADDFATPDDDTSQTAPSQSVLDSPGCTDDMDFSPEDNLPSPFDADRVVFHPSRLAVRLARPTAVDNGCPSPGEQPVSI